MSQHLLFNAAGLNLAAPAGIVKAIHENLDIQSVAGTRRWFAGLAVAGGKLLPVTDMGMFAGRRSSTGRTLELDPAAGIAGLRVDNVVGLSECVPSSEPLNDGEMETTDLSNLALTGKAVVEDEQTYHCLDIAALVQSPAFLNISESDI